MAVVTLLRRYSSGEYAGKRATNSGSDGEAEGARPNTGICSTMFHNVMPRRFGSASNRFRGARHSMGYRIVRDLVKQATDSAVVLLLLRWLG
jgi:hypothetical protein